MRLAFRTFEKADFQEYKSWYEDAELNMRLGPMDDAWLTNIPDGKRGCQLSVFHGKDLVAVIGLLFPDAEHPAYYITDFAVKPAMRGQGFGSEILKGLIQQYPLQSGQSWRAFVDTKNPKAKAFFERSGWKSSEEPDVHGMYTLESVSTPQ